MNPVSPDPVSPPRPAVENLHVETFSPLPTPRALKDALPLGNLAAGVEAARERVRAILRGDDPRPLAIVGPCSVHDPAATLDYAQRLAALREELSGEIEILMRVYVDKPRTTVGWRGFLNDPGMDGSGDIARGLRETRALMRDIAALGLPVATELLDPFAPQYLFDLVSWACLGARTSESQTHRAMASAVSAPMGFKNGTGGSVALAVNAAVSAAHRHAFFTVDEQARACVVHTTGNPDGHVILRGSTQGPNFHEADVQGAAGLMEAAGLVPAVLVDCSHANAARDHTRQGVVWREALRIRAGNPALRGLMLESNLEEGAQSPTPGGAGLRYGQSVTDPCVGWAETEALLRAAAG